jgi:hypothetical protein
MVPSIVMRRQFFIAILCVVMLNAIIVSKIFLLINSKIAQHYLSFFLCVSVFISLKN